MFLKIVFIGESQSGKTQVVRRIFDLPFNETHLATVCVNTRDLVDKREIIMIWDTAGKENLTGSDELNYKDASTGVFCVDLSKEIKEIDSAILLCATKGFKDISKCARLILVGTKSDLVKNPGEKLTQIQHSIEQTSDVRFDTCLHTSAKEELGIEDLKGLMNPLISGSATSTPDGACVSDESASMRSRAHPCARRSETQAPSGVDSFLENEGFSELKRALINAPAIQRGVYGAQLSPRSNFSMLVLEGVIAAAGIAAVAIAFAVLNAATFGAAGLIVAGLGVAATLAGVGLFATGCHKPQRTTEALASIGNEI